MHKKKVGAAIYATPTPLFHFASKTPLKDKKTCEKVKSQGKAEKVTFFAFSPLLLFRSFSWRLALVKMFLLKLKVQFFKWKIELVIFTTASLI